MRDVIVTLLIVGLLPKMFLKPDFGLMVFTWISLMNPHKLCWGFARDLPFAALAAVATLSGLLVWTEPKKIPWMSTNILLVIFTVWMFITTLFALNPDPAWIQWNTVWKIQLFTFVMMMVLTTKERLIQMTWVIALSMGFYGVKGGIFTLRSGGGYAVYGPDGTMLGGNNEVALAMIMAIPLLRYLQLSADQRWIRNGMTAVILLTLLCTLGSQSRGALVGAVAMLFFLVRKSRNKLPLILILVLSIPPIVAFMPESWYNRMHTIKSYQKDGSAMGRINAWHTATNLAKDRLLGGGFKALHSRYVFQVYSPNPEDVHDAHSIYFQELGEHGFVGLILFLLIGLTAWRTAARTIKLCRDHPDLKWLADLNAMIHVSFVGYGTAGLFLGLANFDLYYNLIAIVVAGHAYAKKYLAEKVPKAETTSAPESNRRQNSFVRPPAKSGGSLQPSPKPIGSLSGQS